MFSLIQKLFGKPKPKAEEPVITHVEPVVQMPSVEVAHLSLAAIVAGFPDDLRGYLRGNPGEATVALPVQTILKQLRLGAVKMSLASVHRQAPQGIFGSLSPGEKRMVAVPLGEVFRHVSPSLLERNPNQRPSYLPDSGFNLFGNSANPFELSPTEPYQPDSRVLDIPDEAPRTPVAETREAPAGNGAELKLARDPSKARILAPPPDFQKAPPRAAIPKAVPLAKPVAPAAPARPKSNLPPLVLDLEPLTQAWPDEIRNELGSLEGAKIELPTEDVSAGLARGKVAFTWGEVRSWIQPPRQGESAIDASTMLVLPLKVVAPAFLASSKSPRPGQKKVSVGENIPELFNDARVPEPAAEPAPAEPELTPEPAPEAAVADAPTAEAPVFDAPAEASAAPLRFVFEGSSDAPAAEPAPLESPAPEPPAAEQTPPEPPAPEAAAPETPVLETPAAEHPTSEQPASEQPAQESPAPETPAPEPAAIQPVAVEAPADREAPEVSQTEIAPPAPAAAPAPAPEAIADEPPRIPETVGEIFGQPQKTDWTPAELVTHVSKLPCIAGAIVALQEGLLVAHSLPEDVKSEVVAAFLPQIFARLNQYSGEMKLGEVDDLLFTTHGAHCQIYRLGYIYFAVLGKPGESLPWHELRLIADELSKQTKKA